MQIFTSKLELPDEREPAGNAYQKDATSSDYTHLRAVSQKVLDLVNDYDGVIF